jgi:hypothetical protein
VQVLARIAADSRASELRVITERLDPFAWGKNADQTCKKRNELA